MIKIKDGKQLKYIVFFNENTSWAYKIEYQEDKVIVQLDCGNGLGQRRVCVVKLKDFTYKLLVELTDKEYEKIK